MTPSTSQYRKINRAGSRDEPRSSLSRTRTAYHEAGHAAVAYLCGLSFGRVSVIPDATSAGHLTFHDHDIEALSPVAVVIVCVAGSLAVIASGVSTDDATLRLCGSDEAYARRAVERFYGRAVRDYNDTRFFRDAARQCGKLISQNWQVVERIATLLLVRDKLTGAEAVSESREARLAQHCASMKPKPKSAGVRPMQLTNLSPSSIAATPRLRRGFDVELPEPELAAESVSDTPLVLPAVVKVVYDTGHGPTDTETGLFRATG